MLALACSAWYRVRARNGGLGNEAWSPVHGLTLHVE